MHYKQAVELRDAGFSVKTETHAGGQVTWTTPTLEELIEACGEGFWTLVNSKMLEGTVWLASQYIVGGEIKEKGSTPTEAVARLWLKLHKK